MTKNLILWLVIAVILMTLFESFNSSDNSGRMEDYTMQTIATFKILINIIKQFF